MRRFFYDRFCTKAYVDIYLWRGEAALRDERIFFWNRSQRCLVDSHSRQHKFLSSQSSKMTTIIQVKEAIAALKDRTGSSVVAISKWLESEKKVSSLA